MNAEKRREIFRRFHEDNPEPKTELAYSTPFELLIAVILSAQATDVGVNKATAKLFPVANTPEAIYALGYDGLCEYIRTIGLYPSKAKNVIETCRILIEQHGSQVPDNREALEALPGVGRNGSAARGGSQDRQRGTEHRLPPVHHGGGYAYLPDQQPHRHRPRQKRAGGRAQADPLRAKGISAGRASLADSAWSLCLQGAQTTVWQLQNRRPLRVQAQDI